MSGSVVVGITGASGAVYARRLIQVLAQSSYSVDVVMSAPPARYSSRS
ncbi:MAG: flavoprotein [Pirellulaceae bacterium]